MFRLFTSARRSPCGSLKVAALLFGLCAAASSAAANLEMTEFYYPPLNYYFITANGAEKAALDGTSGWTRTGNSFMVADADAEAAGALPLTRFYFDGIALNKARGSHFYTMVESERSALRAMNPSKANAAGLPVDEGNMGYVYPQIAAGFGVGFGSYCASSMLPVYRAFRGSTRFPDDPNHRFSTDRAAHVALVAAGWDDEGVAFCVPAN